MVEADEDRSEAKRVGAFFRLVDWSNSRELTWLASMLTCFIGLVELVPWVNLAFDNFWSVMNAVALAFIVGTIMVGWVYSFHKYVDWMNIKIEHENKLRRSDVEITRNVNNLESVLYEHDVRGEIVEVKSWVWSLIAVVFTIVWGLLFLTKCMFSQGTSSMLIGYIPTAMALACIVMISYFR